MIVMMKGCGLMFSDVVVVMVIGIMSMVVELFEMILESSVVVR